MQKINLLPEDLAPPGLNAELLLILRKAAMGLGVLIAVVSLVGFGMRLELARKNRILSKIMIKVQESDLLTENIEDLRSRAGELEQELADINVYLSGGLIWSQKLLQISALMPKEVWLNRLNFQRTGGAKEFLDLEGALVSLEGIPSINILSSFINKIKADKDFFKDFDDLLVTEVNTDKKEDVEIMNFKIRLLLKK